MWHLYHLAKTWKSQPSQLLDVVDPFAAYCLDEAVAVFGNTVLNEMSEITHKKPKRQEELRQAHLNRRLGIPRKFADPAVPRGNR